MLSLVVQNLIFQKGLVFYISIVYQIVYRKIYATAEVKTFKYKLNNSFLSNIRKSDYENRAELLLENNWEIGEDFTNRNNKQDTRKQVYKNLKITSKNSNKRYKSILCSIITNLKKELIFNHNAIILDQMKEKIDYVNKVINHVSKAIKYFVPKRIIIKYADRILTGYLANSIPKEE